MTKKENRKKYWESESADFLLDPEIFQKVCLSKIQRLKALKTE